MNLRNMLKRLAKQSPRIIFGVRLGRRSISVMRGWSGRRASVAAIQSLRFKVSTEENLFCGYYDHSPFNIKNETLILVHSTSRRAWRKPSPQTPVSVILYDWKTDQIVRVLGETDAWNWQQGARALWFDSETIIFNVYDPESDSYRARLVDCDGTHRGDLPIAVQEIDSMGRVYGLSYEALAAIRPDYGYRNRSFNVQEIAGCVVERFDPATGKRRSLASIRALTNAAEERHGRPVTQAKFNHVMASPDAARSVFLFRYVVEGRRISDLYVVAAEREGPRLLVEDSGVSHVCWWGDDAVVATMKGADGFGYYIVPIEASGAKLLWKHSDGHPSRMDEKHMLTDTYPDNRALRHLLIHELETGETAEIASFPEHLLLQGETRCDLHPSLSPSGRYIQVDCVLDGRRTIAVLRNPLPGVKLT